MLYSCKRCNKDVDIKYSTGIFCSKSCANKRIQTKETKEKIQNSLNKRSIKIEKICPICSKKYFLKQNKNVKTCSKSCGSKLYSQTDAGKLRHKNMGLKSASIRVLRSKNEIYLYDLLIDYFKSFTILTNEKMFNGWDADIIIVDLKLAILWNGKWHYEKIKKDHSVLQVQTRDKIKLNEIYKCGFFFYVIKDMGRFDKNFVEKEFEKLIQFINYILN